MPEANGNEATIGKIILSLGAKEWLMLLGIAMGIIGPAVKVMMSFSDLLVNHEARLQTSEHRLDRLETFVFEKERKHAKDEPE